MKSAISHSRDLFPVAGSGLASIAGDTASGGWRVAAHESSLSGLSAISSGVWRSRMRLCSGRRLARGPIANA